MHDNASPYTAKSVREYTTSNFPIAIGWPTKSPDLSVLDFCVWGIMETSVAEKMEG